jgi:hypothetical protein
MFAWFEQLENPQVGLFVLKSERGGVTKTTWLAERELKIPANTTNTQHGMIFLFRVSVETEMNTLAETRRAAWVLV